MLWIFYARVQQVSGCYVLVMRVIFKMEEVAKWFIS